MTLNCFLSLVYLAVNPEPDSTENIDLEQEKRFWRFLGGYSVFITQDSEGSTAGPAAK